MTASLTPRQQLAEARRLPLEQRVVEVRRLLVQPGPCGPFTHAQWRHIVRVVDEILKHLGTPDPSPQPSSEGRPIRCASCGSRDLEFVGDLSAPPREKEKEDG